MPVLVANYRTKARAALGSVRPPDAARVSWELGTPWVFEAHREVRDSLSSPISSKSPIGCMRNRVMVPKQQGTSLDNIAAHEVAGFGEAIRAVGANLLYLPPFSSDLNRIKRASPNARRSRAKQAHARRRRVGSLSENCSTRSRPKCSGTNSGTADMSPSNPNLL
jgi:transposase